MTNKRSCADKRVLKKIYFKHRRNALKKAKEIKKIQTHEQILDFIFTKCARPKKHNISEDSDGNIIYECPECKIKQTTEWKLESINIELLKHKCLCSILKEKIDELFQQALLGMNCLKNGRFMFESKSNSRNDTISGYAILDDVVFKNTYLLLSTILEELYCMLYSYKDQSCINEEFWKKNYNRSILKTVMNNNKSVRYRRLAYTVALVANVLKHSHDNDFGKKNYEQELIALFKTKNKKFDIMKQVWLSSFVGLRSVNKVKLSELDIVIENLYIFTIDLIAEVFGFKGFRLSRSKLKNPIEDFNRFKLRK